VREKLGRRVREGEGKRDTLEECVIVCGNSIEIKCCSALQCVVAVCCSVLLQCAAEWKEDT